MSVTIRFKATPARIADLRARLAEGLPDHSAIRLYGTVATPLGAQFQPNLLIMQERYPSTQIEMSVDWDLPDLTEIIAGSDRILRTSHIRAGCQSMGFQRLSRGTCVFAAGLLHVPEPCAVYAGLE
ncbi:MAG: hypothetical protein RLZZ437_2150 [Pseudomonadota bacterium]|jgi:hypothetical protein